MVHLIALAIGLLCAGYIPRLPTESQLIWLFSLLCVLLLVIVLIVHFLRHRFGCAWRLLIVILLIGFGCFWSWSHGARLVASQLDETLAGKDIWVRGYITGLPAEDSQRVRFFFDVESAFFDGRELPKERMPGRLRLSWYKDMSIYTVDTLIPGDLWQLKVRLKSPRGLVNPAGFDYQRWLLARGVNASGYVRMDADNKLLSTEIGQTIDRRRYLIRNEIFELPESSARALLVALALGDKSGVNPSAWKLLQDSGAVHLLAISGLHIGLIAGVGYFVVGWLARFISLMFPYRVFSPQWSLAGAVLCGAFYAALAGFTLPTQRALIMLLVGAFVIWRGCYQSVWPGWLIALCLCLFLDPLAGFDAGFWLSFLAVAALLLAMRRNYFSSKLFQFIKAQWVVFVGLLLPLIVLGLPVSLFAPVINFFAILWVGMLVVPVLLAGVAFLIAGLPGSGFLLISAQCMVEWFLVVLGRLVKSADTVAHNVPFIFKYTGEAGFILVFLMGIACLLLLVPSGRSRWLLLLAFVPLVWPAQRDTPALRLTFLDVGQGVAIVIEAGEHYGLYDTGPAWGRLKGGSKGRDPAVSTAANSVILPFLEARGISLLDKVIISHGDIDHQGGAETIFSSMPVLEWIAGEPDRLPNLITAESCHGRSWQWGEVDFSVVPLLRRPDQVGWRSNNNSCVLSIRAFNRHILLPGDIESVREQDVFSQISESVDVLLSPHHGSLTSSSTYFVQFLQPDYIVVSAGYKNRYGHPHKRVTARYRAIEAQILNTADTGAVVVEFGRDGTLEVSLARHQLGRYWHSRPDVDEL